MFSWNSKRVVLASDVRHYLITFYGEIVVGNMYFLK